MIDRDLLQRELRISADKDATRDAGEFMWSPEYVAFINRPVPCSEPPMTMHDGYARSALGIDRCDWCGQDIADALICTRCGTVQDQSTWEPPKVWR